MRYRLILKDSSYSDYFLTWEELKNRIKEYFKEDSKVVINWFLSKINASMNIKEHPEAVFANCWDDYLGVYFCSKKESSYAPWDYLDKKYKIEPPTHRVSIRAFNIANNLPKFLKGVYNLDKEEQKEIISITKDFLDSLPKKVYFSGTEVFLNTEKSGQKQLKDYFNSLGIKVIDWDDYEKLKSEKD